MFGRPIGRPISRPLGRLLSTLGSRGVTLGPELAPSATTPGSYTLTGTVAPTQDASGIHFVGASNLAAAQKSSAGLLDNATYRVTLTIANYVSGKAQLLLYGATSNHLGQSAEFSANGTYTFDLTTANTGSVFNTIRLRATGVSTGSGNTFDVTALSVRKLN